MKFSYLDPKGETVAVELANGHQQVDSPGAIPVIRDRYNRQHQTISRVTPEGLVEVWLDGRIYRIHPSSSLPKRAGFKRSGPNQDALIASMPGTVVQVRVQVGDAVEAGQALALMESMKMEITLESPRAGTVKSIECAPGQMVEMGAVLLRLEPA